VQGPKSSILAVGDYLRADGPFEGENDFNDSHRSELISTPLEVLKKDIEFS
jgi:hypothetical protein